MAIMRYCLKLYYTTLFLFVYHFRKDFFSFFQLKKETLALKKISKIFSKIPLLFLKA